MEKYIIIPPCSDFNRGDQALVWETARFANEAGFKGEYFFMAEAKEPVSQSEEHGLKATPPLLEHPSTHFKDKDNIAMNLKILVKWGSIAILDFLWSILLLTPLRGLVARMLGEKKQKVYQLFKDSDAVFVKGGGFVHCYGGVSAPYYMYFQLYHIFLAQALGKPVYICPNSFGPFEGLGVKWMVKQAFKNSKIVVAREGRSTRMCKDILHVDVPTYPDFGFFLANGTGISREDFIKNHQWPQDRKLVAITARPHRFPHATNPEHAYQLFVESMQKFAKWLYSEGFFPVFIEHVYAINNHENDSYCIEDITSGMAEGEYAYLSDRTLNCQQLKLVYSYFDYIVGTRFHSMIFSMANMIPGIAITYVGNKGEGIMEDMHLEDYYVRIADVTSETLIAKFKFLVETEHTAKSSIASYITDAGEKRHQLIKRFMTV